jgi:hypothetical protein
MGDDLLGVFQRETQLVGILFRRDDAQRQRLGALGRGGTSPLATAKGPTIIASR